MDKNTISLSVFFLPAIIATYLGVQQPQVKQVETKVEQTETPSVESEPPSRPLTIQEFAHLKVDEKFGTGHWESFDKLVNKESGWNAEAQNPTSTAQGLCQFLKQTRENYGITVESSPEDQIVACIRYVADRYENPKNAWDWHLKHNWY
jgi:hypothetical protein